MRRVGGSLGKGTDCCQDGEGRDHVSLRYCSSSTVYTDRVYVFAPDTVVIFVHVYNSMGLGGGEYLPHTQCNTMMRKGTIPLQTNVTRYLLLSVFS